METIILATDFSEAALAAGEYAAAMTRQIPVTRILLYHSYYVPVTTDTLLTDTDYSILQKDSIDRLNDLKEKLMPLAAEGVKIECLTSVAPLQEAMRTDLLKEDPGLIVMGLMGKSQIKERIMGSQAVIAARHTLIPLLLIPFDAVFQGIKKVVFAWDMKYPVKIFPEKAIKGMLHLLKAELLVFNVDYKNKNFGVDTLDEQKFMHQLLEGENVRFFYNNCSDTAEGIIDFTERQKADVVMVIPRKDVFPESLFRKKVTKRLAFHIKTPLLVLPANG